MKRTVCFPVLFLFSLLGGKVFLLSCRSGDNLTQRITGQTFQPDSTVVRLLGANTCETLYAPAAVVAYKMRSRQSESDTLIGQYAIDRCIGELDASCYSILQFFLKDSANYVLSDEWTKAPFSPNMGFTFLNRDGGEVHLLLAFNGNQLQVMDGDQVVLHRLFRNERYLLRFAIGLLPDSRYLNALFKHSSDSH